MKERDDADGNLFDLFGGSRSFSRHHLMQV